MASTGAAVKLEDDTLRKFYRSFHKHGASNWGKISKDTKLSVEQCEMLHTQHMSFLSLPASPALETAFLAMVDDHYNATQKLIKEEITEEDMARGGRSRRGELEEPDAQQVATSTSQKPRRTPKPTPQRLAAEEEAQARRMAKANQATPKSARAKAMAKVPPSPPPGEWNSSQRKRSRRLFEDALEQDPPRYRSPMADRWRGRHNTDVDEGVDALLSLASGAHALEDRSGADVASIADQDYEEPEPELDNEPVPETPKRARGPKGARSTPTPSATPVKGVARSAAAAAAADALPMPSATGLRSPRARGVAPPAAAAAVAAVAATTPARGGAMSGGRQKKETFGSPTSSQQRGGAAVGAASASPTTDMNGDAGDTAGPSTDAAHAGSAGGTPDGAVAAAAGVPTSPGPSGRPVRKRKPTAIALAAAAAADEEDGAGGRGARSVVAAVAAAVAAAEASQAADRAAAEAVPEAAAASPSSDGGGITQAAEIASNTAALLASVPPVRIRGSARIATVGPGSRRAGDRASSAVTLGTAPADAAGADVPAAEAEERAAAADGPGPSAEAAPVPAAGRGRSVAPSGGACREASLQNVVDPAVRFGPARVSTQPPPGRTRRRKSLPERLPPLWESLRVTVPQTDGPSAASGGARVLGVDAAGNAVSGEAAAAMPLAEIALRHCLGPRVRRWCMYEFLYSALDRPWFLRNELLEFCALHMQLPTAKLTRLEWSVLRAALGRPRRLSLAFLREERLRLEGYRELARLKYKEVAVGLEVPPELPRQLNVQQEVTARHPYSRQLHDGVILTLAGSKYRVQFHREPLMTEVIRDTDIMPVDPHECMPLSINIVPFMLNGRPYDQARLAILRGLLPPGVLGLRPPTLPMRPLGSWATGLDSQMMREQDAAMVAEVQRALEVKEELVAQLTQLNNEAASGLHTDENGGRTDNFQLKYTNVVLRLRDTNAVLDAALSRLQSRQQQILAVPAATFGTALALQQQQQQQQQEQQQQLAAAVVAAATAAANSCSSAKAAGSASAALPALPQQQQALPQQPSAAAERLPEQPPQSALEAPPVEAPPSPLPPPVPSPTFSAGAAAAAVPPSAPALAVSTGEGQSARPAAAAKPAVQLPIQGPPPDAPLVVPPQRASTTTLPSAASMPAPVGFVLPVQQGSMPSAFATSAATPEQLVEQALAEARTVVDGCRGRASNGLLPAGPSSVSVVAPIILQAPGDASVPLVLPPGAVLPPQLVLQPTGAAAEGQPVEQTSSLATGVQLPQFAPTTGDVGLDGGNAGVGAGGGGSRGCARRASAERGEPSGTTSVNVKTEEEVSEVAGVMGRTVEGLASERRAADEEAMTEEELAESWLRDVILGCVGVLFTIQKCTAGSVPAATVADALDVAVQQLQIRTDGENDALYADIVQSVQGLKGHLTRAFA